MARILHFAVPGTLDECARALAALDGDAELERRDGSICYFDRPDRWLRGHGWLLAGHYTATRCTLKLRRLGRSEEIAASAPPTLPALTADIVAPALRSQLERLLGASPLVVTQRWRTATARCAWRNDAARDAPCVIEATAYSAGNVDGPVLIDVHAEPGHEQATRTLATHLGAMLGWQALDADPYLRLEEAWVAAAQSSAPALGPATPAAAAVATVLLAYHARMCAELTPDASTLGADPVHDFRVALRRTRTLLRAFRREFDDDAARFFRNEFAWLSRATSRLRDLDVMLGAVGSANPPYGALGRRERDRLLDFLVLLRQHEQAALIRVLGGARYARLRLVWPALLASLCLVPPGAGAGLGPRVRRALRNTHERVLADATSYASSPGPLLLHELRKQCKRLRYLVDAFAPLYARRDVDPLLAELKHLQTVMGERCDRRAQHDLLVRWRRRRTAPVPNAALRATLTALTRVLTAGMARGDDIELDAALATLRAPAQRVLVDVLIEAAAP